MYFERQTNQWTSAWFFSFASTLLWFQYAIPYYDLHEFFCSILNKNRKILRCIMGFHAISFSTACSVCLFSTVKKRTKNLHLKCLLWALTTEIYTSRISITKEKVYYTRYINVLSLIGIPTKKCVSHVVGTKRKTALFRNLWKKCCRW